jgi:hypothetical protein
MSWQTEIPIIVRTLVNDFGDQPVYSDDRVLQIITVAAKYVQFDVVLDHPYEIDVSNISISPDPTVDRDEIFISLVSLKAACIIDQSTVRTKAASEGIRAALGPASLSVSGNLEGWKLILDKGPCAAYDELTSHWDVAQATIAIGILSPFSGNKFDPELQGARTYSNFRNSFYR